MNKEIRRVKLDANTDILHIVEGVHTDGVPCLLERNGEVLAAVVHPEDVPSIATEPKSKRMKRHLLSLAGVWKDLDADTMIGELYQIRHDSPPSPPVEP